jgi:NAD-dependent dihydropyrimidine dehydrogenase PreA subunit
MEAVAEILRATVSVRLVIAGILLILIVVKDRTRKISYLRVFVQIVSVFVIFLGLIVGPFGLTPGPLYYNSPRDVVIGTNIFGAPFPDGLSVPTMACYYPPGRTVTCVLWQIQAYIYPFWTTGAGLRPSLEGWGFNYITTGLERLAIAFGLIIVMAIILGRLLCGWICPFGLYMDLLIRLRSFLKIRHWELSERFNDGLRQLRYVIIAAILLLSFVLSSRAIIGAELISETQYGQYLELPFCQACPVKPLCVLVAGAFGFVNVEFFFLGPPGQPYQLGWLISIVNVFFFILFTLGSFMVRRLWCRVCPLGGLIAVFNRFVPFKWASTVRLNKDEEKCTKCGICKRVCPTQVTEVYEEKGGDVTSSGCMMCLRCVEMCPYDDCLKVNVGGKAVFKSRNWLK